MLTDQGAIDCEIVVNAAGIWARDVAKMAGVKVPAGAVEHQYMITEKSNSIPTGLPTLRDPDNIFYLKPEPGALAVGGWEKGTPTFGATGVPFSFGRELFQPNQDRLEAFLLPAAERLPILNELGIRTVINGPIPISPDGEPIMGLAPERDNFYVACGFTSGIAASGGAGKAMAEWIVEGEPGLDLWAFDVRRFGSHHMSAKYLAERSVDSYWRYYQIHYPIEELHSARGGRRSPLYPLLAAKNAVFGSRFGWERPNWFAPAGSEAIDKPSFEARPNWFGPVGNECRAARERAVLIDQSSFSKYEISGPGAFASLQRLAAGDLDKPQGALVYTQLCNERGGIEADLTFARLDENRFYMVTGSAFGVRDMGWIRKHLPADGSVTVQELTSARATLNLAGPRSRDILQQLVESDVSNEAFPYMTARELRLGLAPVLALRVTYLGELGYELHLPTEYAAHVYELLWAAGRDLGLADAGYRAINSLRLEKRYLYWGSDITPDYTPYEAGLGFAVSLKKKSDFIGRAALEKAKAAGPRRRLITLLVDCRRAALWRRGDPPQRQGLGRHLERRLGPHDRQGDRAAATCRPTRRATTTTRSRPSPGATPRRASPAPRSIRRGRRSFHKDRGLSAPAQRLRHGAQPAPHHPLLVLADKAADPVLDFHHPGAAALEQRLALGRRRELQNAAMRGVRRLLDGARLLEVADDDVDGLRREKRQPRQVGAGEAGIGHDHGQHGELRRRHLEIGQHLLHRRPHRRIGLAHQVAEMALRPALALARTRDGGQFGGPRLAIHISLLICYQMSNIAGDPP